MQVATEYYNSVLFRARLTCLIWYNERITWLEKFLFSIAEFLEIDKQKPWSRTNAPSLVKASMANS